LPPGDVRWRGVVEAMSLRAEWVVDHRAEFHTAAGAEAMRAIDTVLAGVPDPISLAGVKFRLASFCAWGTGDLEEAEAHARAAGVGAGPAGGDAAPAVADPGPPGSQPGPGGTAVGGTPAPGRGRGRRSGLPGQPGGRIRRRGPLAGG